MAPERSMVGALPPQAFVLLLLLLGGLPAIAATDSVALDPAAVGPGTFPQQEYVRGPQTGADAPFGFQVQVQPGVQVPAGLPWPFARAEYPTPVMPALAAVSRPPLRQPVSGSTPTGKIWLGTPPVSMEVIFDTGSSKLLCKTWETVKNELRRMDAGMSNMVVPSRKLYSHTRSKSYRKLFLRHHGKRQRKRGFVSYGSGQAVTDEGLDDVWVGGHRLRQYPIAEIMADSLLVLRKPKGAGGVMGLQHMKNKSAGVSVFRRMRDRGLMYAFGYCSGKRPDTGTFIWGDNSKDGKALKVLGNIHWAVRLTSVKVKAKGSRRHHRSQPHRHRRPASHASESDVGQRWSQDGSGGVHSPGSGGGASWPDLQGSQAVPAKQRPTRMQGTSDPLGFTDANDADSDEDPFRGIPGHGVKSEDVDRDLGVDGSIGDGGDDSGVGRAPGLPEGLGGSLGEGAQGHEPGPVVPQPPAGGEGQKGDYLIIGVGEEEQQPPEGPQLESPQAVDSESNPPWASFVDGFVETFTQDGPGPASLLELEGQPGSKSEAQRQESVEWDRIVKSISRMLRPQAAKMPFCNRDRCAAIIDSGSNIIAGPQREIQAIRQFAQVRFDCTNLGQLPHLHFRLGDLPISLPPSAYVLKVKLPSWARPLSRRIARMRRPRRKKKPPPPERLTAFEEEDEEDVDTGGEGPNPWVLALEHLHRKRGIDLASGLVEQLEEMAGLEKICMPAFVPININTTVGKLWIVGTPIFNKYYVRWSWLRGQKSPKIFIKHRRTAKACQQDDGHKATSAHNWHPRGAGLPQSHWQTPPQQSLRQPMPQPLREPMSGAPMQPQPQASTYGPPGLQPPDGAPSPPGRAAPGSAFRQRPGSSIQGPNMQEAFSGATPQTYWPEPPRAPEGLDFGGWAPEPAEPVPEPQFPQGPRLMRVERRLRPAAQPEVQQQQQEASQDEDEVSDEGSGEGDDEAEEGEDEEGMLEEEGPADEDLDDEEEAVFGVRELEMDEIRFPHWAATVHEL